MIEGIIYLISWPVILFLSYKLIEILVKKYEQKNR